MKKRQRKKVALAEQHPLERLRVANELWSMDFVFDRTADVRVINSLTIVGDGTPEAVAMVLERKN